MKGTGNRTAHANGRTSVALAGFGLSREHEGTVSVIGSATTHPEMSFPSTSTERNTTTSATHRATLSS